ncbi:MAG: YceI family protein [Planctomycetes bacterium]|nr:YceI family protein [Planctomycetota bacterium]
MKTAIVCATSVLVTLGSLAASSGRAPAADAYQVDPVHSSMVFSVKHMGASNFYGRFNNITGSFTLDDDPSKNSFQVQIQTESVDTAVKKRDDHLKSPDFFNTKQFPTITFKSTQVKKADGDTLDVTGDLTLHGVTKSVTAKVTKTGTGKFGGRVLAGVEANLRIKRSDFGMNFMLEGIGDEIRITVSLEGGRQ